MSRLTYRLKKSQQKENQLVITENNNEPNQKLTEIVDGLVGEWVQETEREDGFKTLNKVIPWSHFNVIFSDG